MNKAPLIKALNRTMLTALAVSSLSLYIPAALHGQSASDKIRLISDALRARDAGDYALAKTQAERLYAMAPNDSNVQILLDSINEQLANANVDNATPESEAAVAPAEAEVEGSEAVESNAPVEAIELSEEEQALNAAEALVEAGDLLGAEKFLRVIC